MGREQDACSLAAAKPVEERLHALLRRLRQARLQLCIERGSLLALADLDLEREAAGLYHRSQVLEARLLPTRLPARDLRPLATQPGRQLGLCQPGLQSLAVDRIRPRSSSPTAKAVSSAGRTGGAASGSARSSGPVSRTSAAMTHL